MTHAPPKASFKGRNPLSNPEYSIDRWRIRFNVLREKIKRLDADQAEVFKEEIEVIEEALNSDDELRSRGQVGSTIKVKAAPKWLREEILTLEATVHSLVDL